MKCQFGLTECNMKAEWINQNGVIVCNGHKLLLDAFNWERRGIRSWFRLDLPEGANLKSKRSNK